MNPIQQLGKQGQDLAEKYLKTKGLKTLERNFRSRYGEIDLIMKDKNTLVFVEVKSRRSKGFGEPLESVTSQKQEKISFIALHYLQLKKALQKPARFDVIGIQMTEKPKINWVKNAFDLQVF